MSVKELTDDDKANCELVGKSISDIIRFSFDDEFRKSIFQLFGVSSSKDTENEITKRLMSMIQNSNSASASKKKKSSSKDKEASQERNDTSEAKQTGDSSTTSTDCDSQSNSQKNWLQDSSEQYMKAAKRKKLNFFSQPQVSQACDREFEFSNCHVHFSNSQPVPSSSLYNRALNSSSELSDDGINFCRKRFKESFEDNACKYLKKNSKSQSLHKKL